MKPSIPQGTRDFAPEVVKQRHYILNTIQKVFEQYCFQPLETPSMENLNTLMGKYGDEGDKLIFKIINNGLDHPTKRDKTIAAFEDVLAGRNNTQITERALRYDLTIPFARFVVMHQNDIAFPFKRYQMQPVWRADRPQSGRYREFWQCDADVVGSNSLINEAELIAIYRQAFHLLNIPQITVHVNNRKILAGLAEVCNATEKMTDITVAIDKLDKIGWEGVKLELENRGLLNEQIEVIHQYLSIAGNNEDLMKQMYELLDSSIIGKKGLEELQQTLDYHGIMENQEWENEVRINFKLARGLNYYTGFITEVTTDAVKMGSIGGGGRYDDLTGLFGLKNLSGVGISFGIDRIYDVMLSLSLFNQDIANSTALIFVNIDKNAEHFVLQTIKQLRAYNIPTEYYADGGKFDKQMKYAHKRNIPYVGIVGEKELSENIIQLKNMQTGDQQALSIDELIDLFSKK